VQGDQFRRLYPERSVMDKRCEYGVYSLRLKQKLLDSLQLEREERRVRESVDTSTGLANRLDKVQFLLDYYVRKNTGTGT
jgi:hypothetical protein